jgi:lipid-A-disaccharide synthase
MKVMISCGEASGDLYAGALVHDLRTLDPHLEAFGFGGERLAAAGAELVGDYRGISVTGLIEAVSVVPRSWKMLRRLGAEARARRPDVVVAIDFPDFNFRLLPIMHRLSVPIVYYVSPQIWAWRAGRLPTLRRYVDRMLVIFPFEVQMYRDAGVQVEFVGHPLVDLVVPAQSAAEFLRANGLDPAKPTLALLPGSRPNEVHQILSTLVEAAVLVARRVEGLQCVVARAPSLDAHLFAPLAGLETAGVPFAAVEGATDAVLAAAQAVVTASGTATVQTALHLRPMVVVYRLAPLTYLLAKRFVRVTTYGMVNLIAGRPVVRELIQERFTSQAVADEAVSLLVDRARADTMRRDLNEVKGKLGGPGASRRAAESILAVARRQSSRAL